MISRRALRIRTFQYLFGYFKQDPPLSVQLIKKQCFQSLDKTYYFYLLILSLLDEFRVLELNDFEKHKKKFIKNDILPLPVFSNHPFLVALNNEPSFYSLLNSYKVNFGNDKDWVLSLYKNIKESRIYKEYLDVLKESSETDTSLFLHHILSEMLYHSELLENYFEEQSQFASEDMYLSLNLASKTVDEFYTHNKIEILPQYKDPYQDKVFVEQLIDYTVQNYEMFDNYIKKYSENWDIERINYSDLLLIKMCMTELIYMPDIPFKTSVDEYIEISKEYSTPQSYVFINGIMVGVIKEWTENGMLKKNI